MVEFWNGPFGEVIKVFAIPFLFLCYQRACKLADDRKSQMVSERDKISNQLAAIQLAEVSSQGTEQERAFQMMKLLLETLQEENSNLRVGEAKWHECESKFIELQANYRHDTRDLKQAIESRNWHEKQWLDGKMSDQEFRNIIAQRQFEANKSTLVMEKPDAA